MRYAYMSMKASNGGGREMNAKRITWSRNPTNGLEILQDARKHNEIDNGKRTKLMDEFGIGELLAVVVVKMAQEDTADVV